MPNISFFELLLIGVVALLVLGPEKLPGAIRTTSLWIGRARRSFNQVKSDIEKELNADEIRRQLHNESILADLDKAKKQARELAEGTNRELKALGKDVDESLDGLRQPSILAAEKKKPDSADSKPASVDEADIRKAAEMEAADATAASAEDLKEAEAARPAPVQDFYNNPELGVVELRGGQIQPPTRQQGAEPALAETDKDTHELADEQAVKRHGSE